MYYEKNPSVAHDIHELRVSLLDTPMTFLTDAGVFSKKMVDYGSQVLLKSLDVAKGKTLLDVGTIYEETIIKSYFNLFYYHAFCMHTS